MPRRPAAAPPAPPGGRGAPLPALPDSPLGAPPSLSGAGDAASALAGLVPLPRGGRRGKGPSLRQLGTLARATRPSSPAGHVAAHRAPPTRPAPAPARPTPAGGLPAQAAQAATAVQTARLTARLAAAQRAATAPPPSPVPFPPPAPPGRVRESGPLFGLAQPEPRRAPVDTGGGMVVRGTPSGLRRRFPLLFGGPDEDRILKAQERYEKRVAAAGGGGKPRAPKAPKAPRTSGPGKAARDRRAAPAAPPTPVPPADTGIRESVREVAEAPAPSEPTSPAPPPAQRTLLEQMLAAFRARSGMEQRRELAELRRRMEAAEAEIRRRDTAPEATPEDIARLQARMRELREERRGLPVGGLVNPVEPPPPAPAKDEKDEKDEKGDPQA